MAACANSIALRCHEAEQGRRTHAWEAAYDQALNRFAEALGDDLLLEVVSELGEDDPAFDHALALAYGALVRLRARRPETAAPLGAYHEAIGQIVADWIHHYRDRWAEHEADLETGI